MKSQTTTWTMGTLTTRSRSSSTLTPMRPAQTTLREDQAQFRCERRRELDLLQECSNSSSSSRSGKLRPRSVQLQGLAVQVQVRWLLLEVLPTSCIV